MEQWECRNCGKKGHNRRACLTRKTTSDDPKTSVDQKTVTTHRVRVVGSGKKGAVCSRVRAFDDNEDTPVANMVIVTEANDRFQFNIMPDMLIAENVVKQHRMSINSGRKRDIQAANGEPMHCSSAVDFGVEYEGQRTLGLL